MNNDSFMSPKNHVAMMSQCTFSPATVASRHTALPRFTGSDKEKLSECLNSLSRGPTGQPLFNEHTESAYARSLERVDNFLMSALDLEGRQATKEGGPSALYVCGSPGTGKTFGVKWCCERAATEFSTSGQTIHVANMKLSNVPHITQVLEDIGEQCGMTNVTMASFESMLKSTKKSSVVVAVLDEIDMMVSVGKRIGDSFSEKALRLLLSWAADPDMRFIVIGISNAVGNDKYVRLQQLGKVSHFCLAVA